MSERPVIAVTGKMPNMQSWYEEKCKRALEELSHLADTIHRPGDNPKRGWPSKQEEIDTHLYNAVRMVLISHLDRLMRDTIPCMELCWELPGMGVRIIPVKSGMEFTMKMIELYSYIKGAQKNRHKHQYPVTQPTVFVVRIP